MPSGVYIKTEGHRKKIGLSKIGNSYMKGKHHSKSAKIKMSIAHKGKKTWNFGKPQIQTRGSKNHNWKGGISSSNERIRHSLEYKFWQDSVKKRDNNCCQKCGENKVRRTTAHHILNFATYPELRFVIDNGVTLCRACHKKFHKEYGIKNNTHEQITKFISAHQ